MKYYVFAAIFFFLCWPLNSQDLISIVGKGPYPDQTKLFFTGYEGFRKTELGSIRATEGGQIDFFTDYHGYCVLSAEGHPSYPLILASDPTCLEWDSIPAFPCDKDNKWLYEISPLLGSLKSRIAAWQDSRDSVLLDQLVLAIDSLRMLWSQMTEEGTAKVAGILTGADLLSAEAGIIAGAAEMGDHKAVMMEFIKTNIEILYHSDRLISLSEAYVAMNGRVFSTPTSARQASVFDVGEWISALGPRMHGRDVTEHFLIYFAGKGEHEVIAGLLETYAGKYECEQFVGGNKRPANMPYAFSVFVGPNLNREYTLDEFSGIPKILALYSSDCPASVAALVALYGFMLEKQIRMPVILVPSDEMDEPLKSILASGAPFGMQTGMKLGSSLMMGAGIAQLPAFIVLDQRNILGNIFYSFAELKDFLADK